MCIAGSSRIILCGTFARHHRQRYSSSAGDIEPPVAETIGERRCCVISENDNEEIDGRYKSGKSARVSIDRAACRRRASQYEATTVREMASVGCKKSPT